MRSAVDDDLAELVAVGHRVSALQRSVDVEVDPEFRIGLRAMLVAAAEREGIGASATARPTDRPRGVPGRRQARRTQPTRTARRLRTRGAILAGVAVGAIAVSGMSAASENAVPGDALYGVKRSTERAQLALASSDLTKGQLFLDFARTRLAEAQAVSGDSDGFAPGARRHGRQHPAGRPAADHDGDRSAATRPRWTRSTRSSSSQRPAVGSLVGRTTGRRPSGRIELAGPARSDRAARSTSCAGR